MFMRKLHIYLCIIISSISFCVFADSGIQVINNEERFEKGSFFDIGVGLGASQLYYEIIGGKNFVSFPAANASIGYTYYFLDWFGLGTGLQFSTYRSNTSLIDQMVWGKMNAMNDQNGLVDYQGDLYEHHIDFKDWRERQDLYLIEFPIAFHFKYKPSRFGMYSSIGIKFAIPVYSHYKNTSGDLIHSAYYPFWNLTLTDIPGKYETEPFSKIQEDKILGLAPINYLATIEFGGLFQLKNRIDLKVGVYGNYGINNALGEMQYNKIDLGFASEFNNCSSFMNEYQGLLQTKNVGWVHPWSVGLKLGVSICAEYSLEKKKQLQENRQQKVEERKNREKELELQKQKLEEELRMQRRKNDSIIYVKQREQVLQDIEQKIVQWNIEIPHKIDSIIEIQRDTIIMEREVPSIRFDTIVVMNQLDSLLQETIIWFKINETTPILEPLDILNSISEILKRYPQIQIEINGHACQLGNEEYNLLLAMRRAKAVAKLLRDMGVDDKQMIVSSCGFDTPFRYKGEGEVHQLAKDRRVEIIPILNRKR